MPFPTLSIFLLWYVVRKLLIFISSFLSHKILIEKLCKFSSAPFFKSTTKKISSTGVGYAICLIDIYMGMYYNTIIGWAVYYLFASFTSKLPWTSCDNPWNTASCMPVTNANFNANQTTPAKEFFEWVFQTAPTTRYVGPFIYTSIHPIMYPFVHPCFGLSSDLID